MLYLVSDRAKALVKLAQTGLGCLSIPDLFHLIQDLVKSYSLVTFRRLRQAQQVLNQAREHLATCEASHRDGVEVEHARDWVKASEAEVKRWQDVRSAYRNHLANLSLVLPPWHLLDSARQSSQEVERQLQAEVEALETLMKTNGLSVKKTVLDKVRKQLASVSAWVDFWWQMVEHDVEQVALTPRWKEWVEELLLPRMYWQDQLSCTRCPRRRVKIAQALKAVQDPFETHPCTQRLAPEVRVDWQVWAAEWARAADHAIIRHAAPARTIQRRPLNTSRKLVVALRCIFGHEGQVGGDKGPFSITDVTGVRFAFHTFSLPSVIQSASHALML